MQQVIAMNQTAAIQTMDLTYHGKWKSIFTQKEYETHIKKNRDQDVTPLPPLYS